MPTLDFRENPRTVLNWYDLSFSLVPSLTTLLGRHRSFFFCSISIKEASGDSADSRFSEKSADSLELTCCLNSLGNVLSRVSEKHFMSFPENFGGFGEEKRPVKAACCGMQKSTIGKFLAICKGSHLTTSHERKNRSKENIRFLSKPKYWRFQMDCPLAEN